MKNFKKLLMAASVASVCQSSIAADAYQLVDLSTVLSGYTPATVKDINNNGTIVGHLTGPLVDLLDEDGNQLTDAEGNVIQYNDYIRGFSTDGTSLIEFQSFADTNQTQEQSTAASVSDAGVSVGVSLEEYEIEVEIGKDDDGNPVYQTQIADKRRAVYFDNAGVMYPIPELEPTENRNSIASGINDNGLLIGFAYFNRADDVDENGEPTNDASQVGMLYDINSDITTIINPLSNRQKANVELNDVNNNGTVVGWSSIENGSALKLRAIHFNASNPAEINTIAPFNDNESIASAVNDDGIVVGTSWEESERYTTAYAYDINSNESIDLGILVPEIIDRAVAAGMGQLSSALDVNTLADGEYQVVGTSLVTTKTVYNGQGGTNRIGVFNAFLYENDELKNLNDLIDCKQDGSEPVGEKDWVLSEAVAINDHGVIIGHGVNNGEFKPFMLIPKGVGETPVACIDPEEGDEDSGSGSVGLISLLLAPLVLLRRRFKNR